MEKSIVFVFPEICISVSLPLSVMKFVSFILPETSFNVQGTSATTLSPCSNVALLVSAVTLYLPGASFVVPTVVVEKRSMVAEIVLLESVLAVGRYACNSKRYNCEQNW